VHVLVIGGTGVIGSGVVSHLTARGASVTTFSRGRRPHAQPESVRQVRGDRRAVNGFRDLPEEIRFDAVVDLTCYTPRDAELTVRTFAGKCEHVLFCSTVCVYGPKTPPRILVSEDDTPTPITEYGRDKLSCEQVFREAAEQRRFAVTIIRPSHTYGAGGPMLDQLEVDGVAWDRVERGLPVFCSGDGLGLWQSTHRDDVGKLFAHAALNRKTYGETYNATRDETLSWRDYHREVAAALGRTARLIFAPAAWLLRSLPGRLGFLQEITQFHGAYDSSKARAHVPAFRPTIALRDGARETLTSLKSRGVWRDSANDRAYDAAVASALDLGFESAEA